MGPWAYACNLDEVQLLLTGTLVANSAVIVGVVTAHACAPALALEYDMTLVGDAVITSFEEDAFDGGAARHGFCARWKIFTTRYLVLVRDLHATSGASHHCRALCAGKLEASIGD